MSRPLYGTLLRKGAQSVASYSLGMVFYLWLFIWIYPSFAHSQALNALLGQLPKGLLQVLGYTVGITHLSGFIGGEFYSVIYLLIMAIFAIFAATRLVAHMAENGSLAYLLATPVPRRRIAATAAAVLLTEVVAIGLVTALGGLLGAALFVRDAALNAVWFLELNLVGTLLFCVVAGYAFVLSCLAPDERSALSLSALLTLVLYALHLAADLTARLAWLGHLSLFSVLDSQALIEGRGPVGADVAGLAFATVLLVAAGVLGFGRRQFSL